MFDHVNHFIRDCVWCLYELILMKFWHWLRLIKLLTKHSRFNNINSLEENQIGE